MPTSDPHPPESRARVIFRWLAAAAYVVAGVLHFVIPEQYQKAVPPGFPSPAMLVAISGVAEIAGGVGLLIRPRGAATGQTLPRSCAVSSLAV